MDPDSNHISDSVAKQIPETASPLKIDSKRQWMVTFGSAMLMFAITFAVAARVEVDVIVDTCGPRQEARRTNAWSGEIVVKDGAIDRMTLPRQLTQADVEFLPEGVRATPVPQNYLWRQPYKYTVESSELDFWGHPYEIRAHGKRLEVVSLGRDGKPGGEGLDKDISGYRDFEPKEYRPTFSQYMEMANFGRMATTAFLAALATVIAAHTAFQRPIRRGQVAIRAVIVGVLVTCVMAMFFAAILAALHFVPQYGH